MADMDTIRSYVAEGMPEFDRAYERVTAALEAWYEWHDQHYDGEPLKEHEVKLLTVLGRL